MKTIKFIFTALVLLILISNSCATDIDSVINQLIISRFRIETISEYERLSNATIEIFDNIDEIILENPPLIENGSVEANESVSKSKIDVVKELSKGFVDISISKGKEIGLVHFNDEASVDSMLSKNREFLYAKIAEYKPSGGTCIHCGIKSGIEALGEYSGDADMILLSDGYNDAGPSPAIESANYAKSKGIRIHTIALGNTADTELLKDITNITDGRFYNISCENLLKDVYRKLGNESKTTVLITDVSGSMDEGLSVECIEYKAVCGTGCVINFFISIMAPLYALAIVLTGFYLIFLAGSPEWRKIAKSAIIWLIVGIVLVSVSKYILLILFGISHALTLGILSMSQVGMEKVFADIIIYLLNMGRESMLILERSAMPILITPTLLIGGILIALKIRYFMVVVLSAVFPLTIFLYSFKPTKVIGRFMMEQTILWTFTQVAMALVFLVTILGINITIGIITMSIPYEIKMIMEFSGLVMLVMTPVIVVRIFRGFLP